MPHKPPEHTQMDWVAEVTDCLAKFVDEYMESIVNLTRNGQPVFLHDDNFEGLSEYIHERIEHKYSLSTIEAAQLIDTLEGYQETDAGLWADEPPTTAIQSMAASTFSNAFINAFTTFAKALGDMEIPPNSKRPTIIKNIKSALNYTIQTWR